MKFIYCFVSLFFFSFINGQNVLNIEDKPSFDINTNLQDSDNLFKLKTDLLNFPSISFQYERAISKRFVVGLEFNYIGKQQFTFLKIFSNNIEDDDFTKRQLQNIKYSGYSFSPEVRIYFGKKKFQGFYIAPFVRFASYDVRFPLELDDDIKELIYNEVTFDGKLNTATVGLSFGAQWRIYQNFYLDWLIVGPHLGTAKNQLFLNRNLSMEEQHAISKTLQTVQEGMNSIDGLDKINFDYDVDDTGAEIKFKNPWIGLRMQIGVGYRF